MLRIKSAAKSGSINEHRGACLVHGAQP